jgi:hypothetical protein
MIRVTCSRAVLAGLAFFDESSNSDVKLRMRGRTSLLRVYTGKDVKHLEGKNVFTLLKTSLWENLSVTIYPLFLRGSSSRRRKKSKISAETKLLKRAILPAI